jgi:hypothetical protein
MQTVLGELLSFFLHHALQNPGIPTELVGLTQPQNSLTHGYCWLQYSRNSGISSCSTSGV